MHNAGKYEGTQNNIYYYLHAIALDCTAPVCIHTYVSHFDSDQPQLKN